MRDLAVLYCLLLYDNTVFLRIYDRYKQQNFNGDIRICVKGHKSEINLTSCPLVDHNVTITVFHDLVPYTCIQRRFGSSVSME
jgi:hypothetical protein